MNCECLFQSILSKVLYIVSILTKLDIKLKLIMNEEQMAFLGIDRNIDVNFVLTTNYEIVFVILTVKKFSSDTLFFGPEYM